MTYLDYLDLCRHWAQNPPVDLMIASYFGLHKKRGGMEEIMRDLGLKPDERAAIPKAPPGH